MLGFSICIKKEEKKKFKIMFEINLWKAYLNILLHCLSCDSTHTCNSPMTFDIMLFFLLFIYLNWLDVVHR